MEWSKARELLGVPPGASLSQIKEAYKKAAFENHPDRHPAHRKNLAEENFKMITEAYQCLLPGSPASSPRVMRQRRNVILSHVRASMPFLFLTVGAVALGCFQAGRAYQKQKKDSPHGNPFLP